MGYLSTQNPIEVTPAMVDAGVAVYRRWEAEAEYNGGSAALDSDVEGLVRAVLCEVTVKPEVA